MHTLVTFPRSGAHYFQNYLLQSTGYKIDKTHKPIKDSSVVTIARNPIDSVSSMVGMLIKYNSDMSIELAVNKILENYEQFYKYFTHHASIVFDYEDLILSPEKVIESFSSIAKLNYTPIEYIDNLLDMPDKKHVKTSVKTEAYNVAKNILNSGLVDLDNAQTLYQKVLSKNHLIA